MYSIDIEYSVVTILCLLDFSVQSPQIKVMSQLNKVHPELKSWCNIMVLLILESEFVFIRLPILNMNLSKKAIKLTGPFQCLYNSWGYQKRFVLYLL